MTREEALKLAAQSIGPAAGQGEERARAVLRVADWLLNEQPAPAPECVPTSAVEPARRAFADCAGDIWTQDEPDTDAYTWTHWARGARRINRPGRDSSGWELAKLRRVHGPLTPVPFPKA